MRERVSGIGLVALGAIVALVVLGAGVISFDWPWNVDEVAATETTIVMAEPPTVYRIEPINLDCRARVHAEVPLEGRREHSLLGQVYRTDTVTMTAIGDVDTCVEGDGVVITETAYGEFSVVVPGESIRFVRPRVDAVRTAESVKLGKGLVGKLTDVFPWVSENNGLTASAYAYAQGVIGGSDCMRAAYEHTSGMIVDAYRSQLEAQGGDPGAIDVRIDGEPDFDQNGVVELDGVQFEKSAAATCEVADDAVVASPDHPANDQR
ncbi:MAG: hypothetical protein ACE5GB_13625 [Acidimicrobiales bacterium]